MPAKSPPTVPPPPIMIGFCYKVDLWIPNCGRAVICKIQTVNPQQSPLTTPVLKVKLFYGFGMCVVYVDGIYARNTCGRLILLSPDAAAAAAVRVPTTNIYICIFREFISLCSYIAPTYLPHPVQCSAVWCHFSNTANVTESVYSSGEG